MRIFGKVCGWFLAAMLALQAIQLFGGATLNGPVFAAEFIVLAILTAESAILDFKKPKHPYLKYTIYYEDGTEESYIEDAKHQNGHTTKQNAGVIGIETTYFEGDKNEVNNE